MEFVIEIIFLIIAVKHEPLTEHIEPNMPPPLIILPLFSTVPPGL